MRREYTLAQIAGAVGMTERNVRAYRSRGLISPPRMRGRVGYYGSEHLAQLRLVQALLGRGLSLTVIAQLVRRGLAHTELARLIRDELPASAPVALSALTFDELEQAEPGLVARMAQLGLGSRSADGYHGDPAFFALANRLVDHGMPPLDVARISQRAAESALELVARLPALEVATDGDASSATPEEVRACAIELATTAFRLALSSQLHAPAR